MEFKRMSLCFNEPLQQIITSWLSEVLPRTAPRVVTELCWYAH